MLGLLSGPLALVSAVLPLDAQADLSDAEWRRLRNGEVLVETRREAGGPSGSRSVALISHPAALVWRAVSMPERFHEYLDRIPVSVLVDERTKDRVMALGDVGPDRVEELFRGVPRATRAPSSDGRWVVYSYQRARMPWPLGDRWVLIRITGDDAAMTQSWVRLAGTLLEDTGSWSVTPVGGQASLLRNEMRVRLGGAALELVAPLGLMVSVRETFRGIERMANDLAARP
jgi:hypothetical protein